MSETKDILPYMDSIPVDFIHFTSLIEYLQSVFLSVDNFI